MVILFLLGKQRWRTLEGNKKGRSERSVKPLLCILSYKRQGTEEDWKVKSP